jgi:hypothetical protein
MTEKSKQELKNKYLKPAKLRGGGERVASIKKHGVVIVDYSATDASRVRDNQIYQGDDVDSEEDYKNPENLPMFVETQESKLLDDDVKQRAFKKLIHQDHQERDDLKSQAAASRLGTWKLIDQVVELGKREQIESRAKIGSGRFHFIFRCI